MLRALDLDISACDAHPPQHDVLLVTRERIKQHQEDVARVRQSDRLLRRVDLPALRVERLTHPEGRLRVLHSSVHQLAEVASLQADQTVAGGCCRDVMTQVVEGDACCVVVADDARLVADVDRGESVWGISTV